MPEAYLFRYYPFNSEGGYIVKLQRFQSEAVDVRCPVITITHANSVVSGF